MVLMTISIRLPQTQQVYAGHKLTLACIQSLCNRVSNLPHEEDAPSSSFQRAASLLVELLFFANSRPLHRQLIAWCRQLPSDRLAAVGQLLVDVISSSAEASVQARSTVVQPIQIAEPFLSLLDAQPLQPFLRYMTCSTPVTLAYVLEDTRPRGI